MTSIEYADVRPMVMLHNALRREFRLLPALVPEEITRVVHVMEGHHDQIDQLTRQVAATLAEWSASADSTVGESLADALDRLIVVLEKHLSAEEESILPVAAKHVTTTEWDQIGEAAGTEVDPALVPVGVGMLMYEGDPEVVEADMARMPPEVWATFKKTAPQAYEAHSLRVHGTLPARSAT
jgi:hypothetical protein